MQTDAATSNDVGSSREVIALLSLRAVQTNATLLSYPFVITNLKKCGEFLDQKFDRFQPLRNNSNNTQQHTTGCANRRYM